MAGYVSTQSKLRSRIVDRPRQLTEPAWVKWLLIGISLVFLTLVLILPLLTVFVEAFSKGAEVYFASLKEADAAAAIRLTLETAAIAVPLNMLFGMQPLGGSPNLNLRAKIFYYLN